MSCVGHADQSRRGDEIDDPLGNDHDAHVDHHGPGGHHGKDHHAGGVAARLGHLVSELFGAHSHDPGDQVDDALEADAAGRRAMVVSLAALGVTAALQLTVVALSGSVALLGDAVHNLADALTAVPLLVAFALARRPPTRRFTTRDHQPLGPRHRRVNSPRRTGEPIHRWWESFIGAAHRRLVTPYPL